MKAYDIEILLRPVQREVDPHGWVFGLPPGIASHEWPLDPNSGYPLMHGFTLLLPEDHRVFGPDIVGFSFFGAAFDHCDGSPFIVDGARALVDAAPTHPRLHRMQDILDQAYALIMHTQDSFDGPLSTPPEPLIETSHTPLWLSRGAAATYWKMSSMGTDRSGDFLWRTLGGPPAAELGYTRAIRWRPRENDPNAGRAFGPPGTPVGEGYRPYCRLENDERFGEVHEWTEGFLNEHIGGTAWSVDHHPDPSPYYVEFGDHFGGFNFAIRNGRLDLGKMCLDW
ncbi:hypothetical protein Q8W71_07195 [Methylobacterium sp. NEAU 140]|uniref:hypothetical protein n=1 Tax=Methylobacterium sp. NEAU 140 TaxID=3064945 RepID=UPI002733D24C|nr:hypothetical protein [Methylobacterium sp. NEAU 140]MDP4022402.1 hypothetical protein [Methylobacterium sp. NEAU 140]